MMLNRRLGKLERRRPTSSATTLHGAVHEDRWVDQGKVGSMLI